MKKVLSIVMALTLVFSLATGCGSNSSTTTDVTDATTASATDTAATTAATSTIATTSASDSAGDSAQVDKFSYCANLDVTSMTPADIRTATVGIFYEVYEMLFGVDNNGDFYPVLADGSKGDFMPGMDHVAGSSDYTIYISPNITDSAGNPITASDVIFSFDTTRAGGYTSGWDGFLSTDKVDDYTVTLHFDRELNLMGELQNIVCRCFIFSEKAYKDSPSAFASDACGTGPYTLTEFVSGSHITVERNDKYWQTDASTIDQISKANVKTITYNMINETNQKVIGLETGALDYAEYMNYDDTKDFQPGGTYADQFKIDSSLMNMTKFLWCNNSPDSLCSDVNLRKAIMYAIDVNAICQMAGEGNAMPAYAFGNSFYPDYNPEWETWDNYETSSDPDKVKEYLAASNYNGETLILMTANFTSEYAEVIQAMLANYGINVELKILDGGTANSTLADPTAWDINYNIMAADDYVVNLWSHLLDDSNTTTGMSSNFINDPEFQTLLDTCRSTEGHTTENLNKFWQECVDKAYVMGLTNGNNNIVYKPNLTTIFKTDKYYTVPGACTFSATN